MLFIEDSSSESGSDDENVDISGYPASPPSKIARRTLSASTSPFVLSAHAENVVSQLNTHSNESYDTLQAKGGGMTSPTPAYSPAAPPPRQHEPKFEQVVKLKLRGVPALFDPRVLSAHVSQQRNVTRAPPPSLVHSNAPAAPPPRQHEPKFEVVKLKLRGFEPIAEARVAAPYAPPAQDDDEQPLLAVGCDYTGEVLVLSPPAATKGRGQGRLDSDDQGAGGTSTSALGFMQTDATSTAAPEDEPSSSSHGSSTLLARDCVRDAHGVVFAAEGLNLKLSAQTKSGYLNVHVGGKGGGDESFYVPNLGRFDHAVDAAVAVAKKRTSLEEAQVWYALCQSVKAAPDRRSGPGEHERSASTSLPTTRPPPLVSSSKQEENEDAPRGSSEATRPAFTAPPKPAAPHGLLGHRAVTCDGLKGRIVKETPTHVTVLASATSKPFDVLKGQARLQKGKAWGAPRITAELAKMVAVALTNGLA